MITLDTPLQAIETTDILLRLIWTTMTIFGSIFTGVITWAIINHFKWKRGVDKHMTDDVGFKQQALDKFEAGVKLMDAHTNALNQQNYRMNVMDRKILGMNARMRELINDHNQRHNATIEPPPIDESPPIIPSGI